MKISFILQKPLKTCKKKMPKKNHRKLPPQRKEEYRHTESQDTICGQELLDALAGLQHDSKYSDLKIICGPDSYAVHRCIVCTRSAFFAKACDGSFKEASTGKVTLDEEPALVKQMIRYLYTLDYEADTYIAPSEGDGSIIAHSSGLEEGIPPTPPEGETSRSELNGVSDVSREPSPIPDPLSFHILMYSLADRLFIQGLKALSKQNVERELVSRLEANSFPLAVIEIYNSTPENDRGLRDLVVRITMDHLTTLRNEGESAPAAFQNDLLQSVPQFAYDLLVAIMNKSVSTWNQYRLPGINWNGATDIL